jgi:hypothetical protein
VLVDDEILGRRDNVDHLARSLVIHAQGDGAGNLAGDDKLDVSLAGKHTKSE